MIKDWLNLGKIWNALKNLWATVQAKVSWLVGQDPTTFKSDLVWGFIIALILSIVTDSYFWVMFLFLGGRFALDYFYWNVDIRDAIFRVIFVLAGAALYFVILESLQ